MQEERAHEPPDSVAELRTVVADLAIRRLRGEIVDFSAIRAAHAHLEPELSVQLRHLERVERARRRALDEFEHASDSGVGFPSEWTPRAFQGYRLTREVHRGGQGVVYEAVQVSTQRRVAVKVTHGGWLSGPDGKTRLRREVRLLAQLRHPNIVTVFDSGTAANAPYFVMDFIEGESLDAYAARPDAELAQKIELLATICGAVHAAHLRGIIHRDLKPSNIRVDGAGVPHVLDFGLAKFLGVDEFATRTGVTHSGQFVGSLPWAAPEQTAGRADLIDTRTDVYALGVMLYQILTGELPYDMAGSARQLLQRIEMEAPRPPRIVGVSRDFETIVLKCLSKTPERRYQSASDLADDLRRCLRGDAITARRDNTLYIVRKFIRRRWLPLSVAAAFIALLASTAIVSSFLYVRSERSRFAATERLYESLIAQARGIRLAGGPGQRVEALRVIAEAAAIRPSLELRNEAIAAMQNPDLVIERRFPHLRTQGGCAYAWQTDTLAVVRDGKVLLWDVATDAPVNGPDWVLTKPNHTDLVFDRTGRYLSAVSQKGGPLGLWDCYEQRELVVPGLECGAARAFFSPDARLLAIVDQDRGLRMVDLESRQILWSRPEPKAWSVSFAPDGGRLAGDADVRAWRLLSRLHDRRPVLNSKSGRARHQHNTRAVATHKDFVCRVAAVKLAVGELTSVNDKIAAELRRTGFASSSGTRGGRVGARRIPVRSEVPAWTGCRSLSALERGFT